MIFKRNFLFVFILFVAVLTVATEASSKTKAYFLLVGPESEFSQVISEEKEPCQGKILKITNPNSYSLDGYQLRLNVLSLSSFSNLSFKLDESYLSYCFEQANGECSSSRTSIVWLKIPHIGANSEIEICVEDRLEGLSSADSVFDFYDDFSYFDNSKYAYIDGSFSFSNSLVTCDLSSFCTMVLDFTFHEGLMFEARCQNLGTASADDWSVNLIPSVAESFSHTIPTHGDSVAFQGDLGPEWEICHDYGAGGGYRFIGPVSSDWYVLAIIVDYSKHVYGSLDGGSLESYQSPYTIWNESYVWPALRFLSDSHVSSCDWIRIRKYSDSELTVQIQ